MSAIIHSIRRYRGKQYWWLTGRHVVITAVRRTEGKVQTLYTDAEIRGLRNDDVIEISPLVIGSDGRKHVSPLKAAAEPFELGPSEGVFRGPAANGTFGAPGNPT